MEKEVNLSEEMEWKVLGSQNIIKNPWLTLREDTCQLPNGQIIKNYYVLEYRTWVIVVALTCDQQVVLVRQYRHGIGRVILEVPGGTTDPGEVVLETAIRRELLEETGYGGGSFVEVGRVSPNPASHNNLTVCFLARDVELLHAPELEETEQIEVVLMPIAEVVQRARESQFLQSLHVSALFFALAYLGKIHA